MYDQAEDNAMAARAAREHEQRAGHSTWVTAAGRRELWRCYRCRWTSDGPHNAEEPGPGRPMGPDELHRREQNTKRTGLHLAFDADGSRDGSPGATLLMNGSHIIASIEDINPGDARRVRLYGTQGGLLATWDRQEGPVAPPEPQEAPPTAPLAVVRDHWGDRAAFNRATEAAQAFGRGILIHPETTYDAAKAQPGIDIIRDGRRILTLNADGTIEINTDEDTDHA